MHLLVFFSIAWNGGIFPNLFQYGLCTSSFFHLEKGVQFERLF